MLTNKLLVKKFRELGYHREAIILEIIGNACEAWSTPLKSEATRSQKLHLLSLLVFRLFGDDGLLSATCLRSEKFGGLPTKKWLNLLANADARRHALCHLEPLVRGKLCEKSLSTIINESSFSVIYNNSTSGRKTDPKSIQDRSTQLDVAHQHKFHAQEDNTAFSTRCSTRQRKFGGGTTQNWRNEAGDRGPYDKDLRQRAAQHTGGSNTKSVRMHVKDRTGH